MCIRDSLENNRVAMYTKMHHSLVDGVGGMRILQQALADSPDEATAPPWSKRAATNARKSKPVAPSMAGNFNGWLSELLKSTRTEIRTLPGTGQDLR